MKDEQPQVIRRYVVIGPRKSKNSQVHNLHQNAAVQVAGIKADSFLPLWLLFPVLWSDETAAPEVKTFSWTKS